MSEEIKPACGLSLEHNPQMGFIRLQGGGEVWRGTWAQVVNSQRVYCCDYSVLRRLPEASHVWHDLASAPHCRPADSESELSVSGFLSVASYSCEEDEGRDAPLHSNRRHPSALRGPTGMSGECNHGNQPAQHNGVEKHRWDTLQLWCHTCLLASTWHTESGN